MRIQKKHALVHIIGNGLQLLLFAFIAAHFPVQGSLLLRKALHNGLQLGIHILIGIGLLQIEALQRLQCPTRNAARGDKGTTQNQEQHHRNIASK